MKHHNIRTQTSSNTELVKDCHFVIFEPKI